MLALQGAFREHLRALAGLGVAGVEVRLPRDLTGLSGLIIPGGESTTIGKLSQTFGLMEPLRRFAARRAVWGTCAGMIFLARDCGAVQPLLGMMDIAVRRNAFGRQAESFTVDLRVPELENGTAVPFPGVFIRAPRLLSAERGAQIIARLPDGRPVAARQGRWLATAFHPELTPDLRFHRYFLKMAGQSPPRDQ